MLTTYYPRHTRDSAGLFVSDLVARLRDRGVEIDVVRPGVYNDYGLAYGWGVVRNVKRRPWKAPLMLGSMMRALRRAAKGADLVHIHWLLAAPLGLLCGRPFVVTLHGTPSAGALEDLALLREARWFVGPVLRRARAVICVSQTLANAVSALGANAVAIPNGVEIPAVVGEEAEPAEILFAGRLAEEKGIEELAIASRGMNLVVAGDGPLRPLVPQTLGRVSHDVLEQLYARAAIFVMPSRSEGFGVVCIEAMAHARPVVASRVGGLAEIVVDGKTGILLPPRRPDLLRAALQKLLDDPELRRRMGRAGRERTRELYNWDRVTELTLGTYRDAVANTTSQANSVTGKRRSSHAVLEKASRIEKAQKIAALLGAPTLKSARILEIGTGGGVISAEFSRLAGPAGLVHSVDVVDERVVREGFEFSLVRGTKLPFPAESFDIVVSNHVIEHVGNKQEQAAHLREIARVLKPDGRFYLASPSRWTIVEPHFRLPFLSWLPEALRDLYVQRMQRGSFYDCSLLTRREVCRLFRAAGLQARDASLEALSLYAREESAPAVARLVSRLPSNVLHPVRSAVPTMIFVGRRT